MQAARRRKSSLRLAQPAGELGNEPRRDFERTLDVGGLDGDRLERTLSANAAGGAREEAPAKPLRVEPGRLDVDGVGRQVVGKRRADRREPLREAEAERELLVVARSAHRDRD